MLYVGLYQSRFVGRLLCPIFAEGCEGVADAPFARPFGIPDGYIGAVVYVGDMRMPEVLSYRGPLKFHYFSVSWWQHHVPPDQWHR